MPSPIDSLTKIEYSYWKGNRIFGITLISLVNIMTGQNDGFLMASEIEFGIAVLIIVFNNFVIPSFPIRFLNNSVQSEITSEAAEQRV